MDEIAEMPTKQIKDFHTFLVSSLHMDRQLSFEERLTRPDERSPAYWIGYFHMTFEAHGLETDTDKL